MKKRALLWMFLLVVLLVGLSVSASAATIASGNYGDVVWTVDDSGVLTISGNGEMGKQDIPPWHIYKPRIHTIRVEEGVTNITKAAFSSMVYVTNVYIPSTERN